MLSQLIHEKGEFELKYTFPQFLHSTLDSWLRVSCRQDEIYPISRVQTIYLETTRGDCLAEKVNSDFFKTKYRVRWYELETLPVGDEATVFLEIKSKVGAKRIKQRRISKVPSRQLKSSSLSDVFHARWTELMGSETEGVLPNLHPLVQISYTRKRFVEPFTGARLSLDYDIRVEKTNGLMLPPPTNMALPSGVFEIKSPSDSPPPILEYFLTNVVRKANFSKYEQCVLSLDNV